MNTTQETARSGRASSIAWGLAPVAWGLAVYGSGLVQSFAPALFVPLFIVVMALPAPWLLWASWRMPRPALRTYLIEGGALLSGFVALYLSVLIYMIANDGPAPVELMVIFFGAAAVFVAAAWPLPGRRIAYGAAALACVILGIGLRVLYSDTSYYPGIDWVTKDELFAWAFLGLPALGVLLQIAWWLRRRVRAV
ncbi:MULTISPECIES: hypothetical protein [Glycomyces]|uniref:Uncharacterized protein n=2 Tax=Glycomyces TaxID=58113 RepID=A0A9X3T8T9_9ACTN|nr:hypothetical protein [Glycomyces lechevalierae]MDA1385633.1 hypothetical protein [Glycomyces lechevalierae]MDR7339529.1 hypothetical protein [Glycomyces lechevalierae]